MDFGIARVAGTEHLTSAGFMMGTPAYMAPEQVLRRGHRRARRSLRDGRRALSSADRRSCRSRATRRSRWRSRGCATSRRRFATVRAGASRRGSRRCSRWRSIASRRAGFRARRLFREALRRGLANLPLETPESSADSAGARSRRPRRARWRSPASRDGERAVAAPHRCAPRFRRFRRRHRSIRRRSRRRSKAAAALPQAPSRTPMPSRRWRPAS